MTHRELVARAKAILAEAYEEAAEMVVLWLDRHPDEKRQTLCKEIDPENWQALDSRVRRAQTHKANAGAKLSPSRALPDSRVRHARSALREAAPEDLIEIMKGMAPDKRAAVIRAAIPPPDRTMGPRQGRTFIDLIVRVTSSLIELEGMVADWQNLSAVPREFSRESFNDIKAKVNRIDRAFAAIDDDDDDAFLKIVRNFRVTSDVG